MKSQAGPDFPAVTSNKFPGVCGVSCSACPDGRNPASGEQGRYIEDDLLHQTLVESLAERIPASFEQDTVDAKLGQVCQSNS